MQDNGASIKVFHTTFWDYLCIYRVFKLSINLFLYRRTEEEVMTVNLGDDCNLHAPVNSPPTLIPTLSELFGVISSTDSESLSGLTENESNDSDDSDEEDQVVQISGKESVTSVPETPQEEEGKQGEGEDKENEGASDDQQGECRDEVRINEFISC